MSTGSVAHTLQTQRGGGPVIGGAGILPNRGGPGPSNPQRASVNSNTNNTKNGEGLGSQPSGKEKLKLVVRFLPPNIDEAWLMGLMRTWVNDTTLQSYYFVQGHVSRKGALARRQLKLEQQRYGSVRVGSSSGRSDIDLETKPDVYSRLYLTMKSHEALATVVKEFNHSVVPTILLQIEQDLEEENGDYDLGDLDSKSNDKKSALDLEKSKKRKRIVKPTIEYAPFQGKLKPSKPPLTAATIEQDEDFKKFVRELEKDLEEKQKAKDDAKREQEGKENGSNTSGAIVLKLDPNTPTMVSKATLIAAGVIPKEKEKAEKKVTTESKADKPDAKKKADKKKEKKKEKGKEKESGNKEKKGGSKEKEAKNKEKDKSEEKDGKSRRNRRKKKEEEEGKSQSEAGGDSKKKNILERPASQKTEQGSRQPVTILSRAKDTGSPGGPKSTTKPTTGSTGGSNMPSRPASMDSENKIPKSSNETLGNLPSGPTASSRNSTSATEPSSAKPEASDASKGKNNEKRKRRRNRNKKEGEDGENGETNTHTSKAGDKENTSKGPEDKNKSKPPRDNKKREVREKAGEAKDISTGPHHPKPNDTGLGNIPTAPSGSNYSSTHTTANATGGGDKKKRNPRSRNGPRKASEGHEKEATGPEPGQQQPPRGPRGRKPRGGTGRPGPHTGSRPDTGGAFGEESGSKAGRGSSSGSGKKAATQD